MSYAGTVRNGVVVLPAGVGLPDGAQVEVRVVDLNGTVAAEEMADRRVTALRELAAGGGISGISNPEDWQRQTRADRDLPGRT